MEPKSKRITTGLIAISNVRALLLGSFVIANVGVLLVRMESVTSPQQRCASTPTFPEHSRTENNRARTRWERAMRDADNMLQLSASNGNIPNCLLPNTKGTMELVERTIQRNTTIVSLAEAHSLPLPVLNMGMPKTGSTTLAAFFQCIGLNGTHQEIVNERGEKEFEGICMRDAVNMGLPPIQTCDKDQQFMMQMDVDFPLGFAPARKYTNGPYISSSRDECFFPQLSLLEDFHKEVPQATFIMNFRPMQDWVKSMSGWGKPPMMERFRQCNLPNKPKGIPREIKDEADVMNSMQHFMCSHVLHVRQFVEEFPTHALIELDLYDSDTATNVMSALFPSKSNKEQSCWKHSNKSRKKKKKD